MLFVKVVIDMLLDKAKTELAMARKQLSKRDLAKVMKLSEVSIFGYFKPNRELNPQTIGGIANVLDVDPSEIVKVKE